MDSGSQQRDTSPPTQGRAGSPRCPTCGSIVAGDATWCSLCHGILRLAPAHGGCDAPGPDPAQTWPGPRPRARTWSSARTDDEAGSEPIAAIERGIQAEATIEPDELPDDVEAAARLLLVQLAVTERADALPRPLAMLTRLDSKPMQVLVTLAGALVLTVAGLLLLTLLGLLF